MHRDIAVISRVSRSTRVDDRHDVSLIGDSYHWLGLRVGVHVDVDIYIYIYSLANLIEQRILNHALLLCNIIY